MLEHMIRDVTFTSMYVVQRSDSKAPPPYATGVVIFINKATLETLFIIISYHVYFSNIKCLNSDQDLNFTQATLPLNFLSLKQSSTSISLSLLFLKN